MQPMPPTTTKRRSATAQKQPVPLSIRVDAELMKAIDAEMLKLRRERPGANIRRSDVVRELCWRALAAGRA